MKNFMIALVGNLILFAIGFCFVQWYEADAYPELNGMSEARAKELDELKAPLSISGHKVFYDEKDKWYHFVALPEQRALWMQFPGKDGKMEAILAAPNRKTADGMTEHLDLTTMTWRKSDKPWPKLPPLSNATEVK